MLDGADQVLLGTSSLPPGTWRGPELEGAFCLLHSSGGKDFPQLAVQLVHLNNGWCS
jgi:hypothetical protein